MFQTHSVWLLSQVTRNLCLRLNSGSEITEVRSVKAIVILLTFPLQTTNTLLLPSLLYILVEDMSPTAIYALLGPEGTPHKETFTSASAQKVVHTCMSDEVGEHCREGFL